MTIKEQLQTEGTTFSIKGKMGTYKVNDGSISETELFGRQMNVQKYGPTCVTLYTYNMLGKKTVGKIKYENVIIVPTPETKLDIPSVEPEDMPIES
jgi:hypothetical protein